jgi:ATP-binding cassette subfamily F protein uup
MRYKLMALITLRGVNAGYGPVHLIENASLSFEKGERIALTGRNGCGKTTFMKLLLGQIECMGGEIERQASLRVAYLEQEVPRNISGKVREVILSGAGAGGEALAEYSRLSELAAGGDPTAIEPLHDAAVKVDSLGGWDLSSRVDMLVSKLKLPDDVEFGNLSAGLKRKVMLAKALAGEPDMLLLDEPTNHLDIASVSLMEDILISSGIALLFVTHDRAFLRRVSNRILELERARLRSFDCNYETFLKRRDELLAAEQKESEQFDKKLAEEEVWIRRGIQGRRTRNEGRVRSLIAMREEKTATRKQQGLSKMNVQQAGMSGRLVAQLSGVSFAYETECPIVRGLDVTVSRGDRIAVIGPNGIGKSTLLKLILGELEASEGRVRLGTNLEVAYFDQLHNTLDETKTVVDNVADGYMTINIDGSSRNAIGYLRDFLFPAQRCKSLVSALSGGERTRLLLARLFAKPSNVLVLDEPTNNLDIETIELLEEQLAEYNGTILLVSHDRSFINNVATSTLVFTGGAKVKEYFGGYDDYLRQSAEETADVEKPAAKAKPKAPAAPKLSYHEKKELEALPEQIDALEKRIEKLHADMAAPQFYKQPGESIAKAGDELASLEAELEAAYDRWQELESI